MTNVAFRGVDDPPGLEILDRVNKRQFTLYTSEVPDPKPASTEPFVFPVEEAQTVVIDGFTIPEAISITIRDRAGSPVMSPDYGSTDRLPTGAYAIEMTGRLKTYILVDAPLTVKMDDERVAVHFGGAVEVTVGVRTYLRRPPTTVTTTPALDDIRRAVETLSSSLQTLSPERSYPTLRGHPPRIEIASTLEIPETSTPPETGITLHVPRELSALFRIASLSYYLGAGIAFGDRFRIESTGGFSFDLDRASIEAVLQHVFLLDCLVRTHGLYPQKHREYQAIASELPFDMETLYDAPPAKRLETYLSVPTSVTEPHVPRWPSVAYVDPAVDRVEALPHLVDDMSLIRTSRVDRYQGDEARRMALSRFVTSKTDTRGASAVFDGREAFVDVPVTASASEIWVGDGIPITASKFVRAGHEHQTEREPSDHQQLRVQVVCNDRSMADEATVVESRYQLYDDYPVDVTVREQITVDELTRVLRADSDFFHFIGHATEDGLECKDGYLDAATLPAVDVDSFLLNACQSYQQGIKLVERGAIGGIVTLSDVPNDTAIVTGGRLTHLLNEGFTLQNALLVARQFSVVGGQYTLVGDGRTTLVRATNQNQSIVDLRSTTHGYELREEMFLNEIDRIGTQSTWLAPDGWRLHLVGGEEGPFRMNAAEVLEYLQLFSAPVSLDGEFHWSTEVTRADLPD